MPMALVQAYLEALPGMQAEVEGLLLEASSYPHMEKDGRRTVLRRLERAVGTEARPVQKATRAALKLIGIGVKIGGGNEREPR